MSFVVINAGFPKNCAVCPLLDREFYTCNITHKELTSDLAKQMPYVGDEDISEWRDIDCPLRKFIPEPGTEVCNDTGRT